MKPSKDKTSKERQARRREREKLWLLENGWKSWEAIHTALLKGFIKLVRSQPEKPDKLEDTGKRED